MLLLLLGEGRVGCGSEGCDEKWLLWSFKSNPQCQLWKIIFAIHRELLSSLKTRICFALKVVFCTTLHNEMEEQICLQKKETEQNGGELKKRIAKWNQKLRANRITVLSESLKFQLWRDRRGEDCATRRKVSPKAPRRVNLNLNLITNRQIVDIVAIHKAQLTAQRKKLPPHAILASLLLIFLLSCARI